jgi:hypothetical protein
VGREVVVYRHGAADVAGCGAQLKLGDSEAALDTHLAGAPCNQLRRSVQPQPDKRGSLTRVTSPLVFGARNWVLLINTSDGQVVGVRYRTADSVNEHPSAAPPDEGQVP